MRNYLLQTTSPPCFTEGKFCIVGADPVNKVLGVLQISSAKWNAQSARRSLAAISRFCKSNCEKSRDPFCLILPTALAPETTWQYRRPVLWPPAGDPESGPLEQ